MKISPILSKLAAGKDLKKSESQGIFYSLFTGRLSELQTKSLLLLLARKGESSEEILGCLEALRRIEPPQKKMTPGLIDTCGTGGDKSGSLNVSTLAAFVIAGAGGKVAKHGNRSLSSKCGSSDLMEALGVSLNQNKRQVLNSCHNNGIGYLHAPFHHPALSRLQPLRKSLKIRTILNLLGPLMNPLNPEFQMIGVSQTEAFDRYAAVLKKLKTSALIVQSLDGLDEISVSAPTKAAILQNGALRLGMIHPQKFGFKKSPLSAIRGGGPSKNAKFTLSILRGRKKGPARNIVVLNAAAGLVLCGIASSFSEGVQKAEESIDSGRAYGALRGLIRDSRR